MLLLGCLSLCSFLNWNERHIWFFLKTQNIKSQIALFLFNNLVRHLHFDLLELLLLFAHYLFKTI